MNQQKRTVYTKTKVLNELLFDLILFLSPFGGHKTYFVRLGTGYETKFIYLCINYLILLHIYTNKKKRRGALRECQQK